MNNERYNQIIDEVYRNYADSHWIPSLDAKPKEEPTMIDDWLNEYGDPEIYKKVERELELREAARKYAEKESFIHEIKTNPEFSKKWGLKIEERELSVKERLFFVNKSNEEYEKALANKTQYESIGLDFELALTSRMNELNIPTKLITVTYKDEKIEVYE